MLGLVNLQQVRNKLGMSLVLPRFIPIQASRFDFLASDYESHEESFDENDDDRDLSFEIRKWRMSQNLEAANDFLSQYLADKQNFSSLENNANC